MRRRDAFRSCLHALGGGRAKITMLTTVNNHKNANVNGGAGAWEGGGGTVGILMEIGRPAWEAIIRIMETPTTVMRTIIARKHSETNSIAVVTAARRCHRVKLFNEIIRLPRAIFKSQKLKRASDTK